MMHFLRKTRMEAGQKTALLPSPEAGTEIG